METMKSFIENDTADQDLNLECTVTDILHQMGIPANIKGYQYLRHAIILCVRNSKMINSMTKLLYPAVAMDFNTTPASVESAIRRVIFTALDRGDPNILNAYFGRKIKEKPTNSEFIALISDRLRLQHKFGAYSKRINPDK